MAEKTPQQSDVDPIPDGGDLTPPHGDEVVNRQRNASRTETPRADDPDNDRPAGPAR
jgi:hypothetical protein